MSEIKEVLNVVYDNAYPNTCLLDMYLPLTNNPCPVLIYFHGGGIESGSRKTGEIDALKRLAHDGIAVVSVDYRMYPQAKFPDFLNDAAHAFSWVVNYREDGVQFSEFYLGGASAGAYMAMMLYFDSRYLEKYGVSTQLVSGWIFDAGQPTVHFNVLRERHEDTRAIRVDEAAPLYFINKTVEPKDMPRLLIFVAENDMFGRFEQTQVLLKTLQHFDYDMSRITYKYMEGFGHCEYIGFKDEKGDYLYAHILRDFITGND